jgi:hypothetical protein
MYLNNIYLAVYKSPRFYYNEPNIFNIPNKFTNSTRNNIINPAEYFIDREKTI